MNFDSSSETQGQLVGARGNQSRKEMKRRMFTSKAKKAPGNRLLPDHFQTAPPMLPPDWAEKSFVLFCPIGEQQLAGYCGVFLHDGFCIAILVKAGDTENETQNHTYDRNLQRCSLLSKSLTSHAH